MTGTTSFSGYDRASLTPTVVHIGPGNFHRAHQAVYCDTVLRTGARSGAVWAISLRSAKVRDALACAGFVYHLVERAQAPDGESQGVRPIGALLGVDVAAQNVERALARLADPAVTVATVTVTEHGYCAVHPAGPLDPTRAEVAHDLRHPGSPRSLPGLLLEALVRRRAAGVAPFTVASCDNLPSNGLAASRVVLDLAECRDPRLAEWVRSNVAFPSSMVDRMVPATTDDELAGLRRAGITDHLPVVTEPFSQWVLEDVFPAGRPQWERAGVELVSDVGLHEQAKLRILNAAHSALAYWGLLAGHRLIWQAVADPALLAATRDLLAEILPTVAAPPGWDLPAYAEQVLRRFANSALPYTTAKVAEDGSQKLPVRIVPTVRALLATGAPATHSAQLLAAWAACLAGPRAGDLAVRDAVMRLAAHGRSAPTSGGPANGTTMPPDFAVDRLMNLPGFFDPADPREQDFVKQVRRRAATLWISDIRIALALRDGNPADSPGPTYIVGPRAC
ncbi:mannitol dehydrogenase family protein [Streptosporangiaceae bacterium NEAU-GS5]|nr:mannitol dehydrogenase family protein [Streptosporangiaceae bacterium NEAU-GS5]